MPRMPAGLLRSTEWLQLSSWGVWSVGIAVIMHRYDLDYN